MGESSESAKKVLAVFDKVTELDMKGAVIKSFKLDEVQSEVKKKLGGSIVNVFNEVRGEKGIAGGFKAAGKGLSELIKMAPKLGMALGIGAIFALATSLIHTFLEADKEVSQLGKDFGISKDEAKELHHTAHDVADELRITGIHSEEVAKGLKTASENLGGLDLTGAFNSGNAAVQQMVKDTTILTEKFGLSGEEAGNLNNIAAITGKSVGEMSMMATKLGNGIFSAKESMKILAGIPKSVVSSMSKMPEAMIKTAIHAKALGMNMKQIADIGRKSLDIEQSLQDEMEARAIIGKNINLDGMRAAALNGDQEGVANELLKAAGSMQDFNNMNVLQKEALAKAAGMEVDQMAEMLGKQEELNKAGLSQAELQKLQSKNAADLASLAAGTNDKNKKAYLEKLVAEKKSEETQASMADLMKRIQELAVKLVTPIMDVVDAFMNGEEGAAAMDGILNVVGGTIKMLVPGMKLIASLIGYLIKPLSWIAGAFSSTGESTEHLANATGKVTDGVEQTTDKVKPLLSGFGSLLGIVTSIGGLFAGKALLGKGMDLLKDKAADLGKTLVSKVKGPLGDVANKLVGGKAGSGLTEKGLGVANKAPIPDGPGKRAGGFNDFFEKMDPKKMLAGAAALLIVSAALYVAAKAMQQFSTGVSWEGVMMGIVTLGALVLAVVGLGTLMSSGVGTVAIIAGAAAMVILSGAMYVMGKAMQEFAKAAVIAIPVFETLFKGVVGIIAAAGQVIVNVISAFTGGITTIIDSFVKLGSLNPTTLLGVALGITAISGALATFGGGSFIAGLGGALGKLFDEDPVAKFNRFATIDAKGLDSVAKAILSLGQAIQTFSNISGGLNLDKIDEMISKIEKLKEAQTSSAISDLGTTVVGGLTNFVGSIFGSNEKQSTSPVTSSPASVNVSSATSGTNMANVEKKLDTLISLFSQAAAQPTVIKFGEKTVEEFKSALNFKKAYNIGIDNTYGRSI